MLRTRTATLVVALVAVLSACSSEGSASSDDEVDKGPEFPTYVALGDSYTAAPGVPNTDLTTGCARSDSNYPHLLAAELGADLTDVSCSGASTLSLIGAQEAFGAVLPAQFEALTPETSLVTLGIGGNDQSLFSTLVGTCTQLAQQDPQGSPCRANFTRGNGDDKLLADVATIGDRVTAAVEGVRDRAPDAEVVLVGYPQPVPESGTCPELPLAAGDYAYVREVTSALNDALEAAAEAGSATYVDVEAASEGHDVCAGDEAWVNGTQTDLSRAIAFHPFAVEQQAVAELVAEAIS